MSRTEMRIPSRISRLTSTVYPDAYFGVGAEGPWPTQTFKSCTISNQKRVDMRKVSKQFRLEQLDSSISGAFPFRG